MILLLDLSCRPGSLSADEFVGPVERIACRSGCTTRIGHYTEIVPRDLPSVDGTILCGTALADSGYLDRLDRFAWLPSFSRPVLGICAGMQVIARIFGGEVRPDVRIGMAQQEVAESDPLLAGKDRFEAYELHTLSVIPPASFRTLAASPKGPALIRHRERRVYGVMFHPEVRNEWLIERFLAFCSPGTGNEHEPDEGEQAS
jgi:GMP synthase-like glutamine amidotransferase